MFVFCPHADVLAEFQCDAYLLVNALVYLQRARVSAAELGALLFLTALHLASAFEEDDPSPHEPLATPACQAYACYTSESQPAEVQPHDDAHVRVRPHSRNMLLRSICLY